MDSIKLKALVEASVMSGFAARSKAAYEMPLKRVEHYSEIALPYLYKQAKIEKLPGLNDINFWKDFHNKQKEAIALEKKLKENE